MSDKSSIGAQKQKAQTEAQKEANVLTRKEAIKTAVRQATKTAAPGKKKR
jgi:hypothetical protein